MIYQRFKKTTCKSEKSSNSSHSFDSLEELDVDTWVMKHSINLEKHQILK